MRAFRSNTALLPLVASAVLLLASCSSYDEVELKDITNVEVLRMDGKQVALRVDALVNNPNGFKIHVEDPDVDLYLNDRFVGKGLLDSALVLDRKSTKVYPVYLHADLQGGAVLFMLLGGALSGELKLGAKGTVAGRSGMLKKRFPFELEETIDLRSGR
ncbi:MAG: LEA type 2 family protein [Flavobacteriales bacterium]|nr:LEA type 2 family protein [Flavobacteriales bacterium]